MTLRTCPLCGAPRKFPIRKCANCRKPFAAVRSDKRCCSIECSKVLASQTYYTRVRKPQRAAAKKGKRK
jgi:hypothetical protein